MQLIKLESSKTTQLFWVIAGALAAVGFLTANQQDPGITAAGVLLALAAIMPFYFWLLGWSHGLPIWPVFSLVLGTTYALPMLQNPETLREYSSTQIILGGITTIGFILVATTIWLFMTSETPKAPRYILMIEERHAVQFLLLFVAGGVLFGLNQLAGWIQFPGNLMSAVRGVVMSLNALSLFVLAFYQGRGMLSRQTFYLYAAGAVATILMGLTTLLIAQVVVPVAMVIFGYMLGSNKMPWRLLAVVFVLMAVLHAGKYEMRERYWSGENEGLTIGRLPTFYVDWFNHGMVELGGLSGVVAGGKRDDSKSSVFERSGNLHMLLLVQELSPQVLPFLMGETYSPIPRLLVPRFIDDQKGISHAGNIILSLYYGLQTEDQTRTTSIAWGLLPEAYANFGFVGVLGLAVVLALFYSFVTKMTVGVPMTSLRFVIGLLLMAAATTADTMGVFISTQFQGILGVSFASIFLMRRHENPFTVAEGEGTVAQDFVPKWKRVRSNAARGQQQATLEPTIVEVPVETPTLLEQFAPAIDEHLAGKSGPWKGRAAPPEARSSLGIQQRKFPKWASAAQKNAIAARDAERLKNAELAKVNTQPTRQRQVSVPHQHLSDWRVR